MGSAYSRADLVKPLRYHDFRRSIQHEVLGTCLARLFNHQQHHQFLLNRLLQKHELVDEHWNCVHCF